MAKSNQYNIVTELQIMASTSRETLTAPEKQKPNILEIYVQPCLVELLGTTLLISIVCLSVMTNPDGASPLQPALAQGFTLASLISVLGNVSGGHFNPAITLAVVLCGGMTPILIIPYWICQLSGGMLGALLAKGLADEASFVNQTGAACMVNSRTTVGKAVGVEIVMTFFLILIVLMGVVGERSKTKLAPYSVAFTLIAAILIGGSISGSCLNPARALGPAIVASYWDYHWVYWVGPTVGSLLVSIGFRFLLAGQAHRLFCK
ncbi:aquaporin-8 isoform X1 [Pelobates cultripes]|uniref:Aquaporin-4 n=1 Tax=Pelobates cultripes TaxID=61616 RepID=A0AAD1S3K5_PELCU|nr:aquaporin-8 isoform X1 [Pelobates cultripes]